MITTQTLYTKKVYGDFATYFIKTNKSVKIIYICAAIMILCGLLTIFAINEVVNGIIFCVIGVLFALYSILLRFLVILGNKKNIDTVDVYEFDTNKFSVNVRNKDGKEIGSTTLNYEVLHSVKLYKNYAYIYINKTTAYIILKENFTDENQFNLVVKNIENNIVKK